MADSENSESSSAVSSAELKCRYEESPLSDSQSPAPQHKFVAPRRPALGVEGRTISLKANHLEVSVRPGYIFQVINPLIIVTIQVQVGVQFQCPIPKSKSKSKIQFLTCRSG